MADDPPKPLIEKVKEAVLMPRFWHGMLFTTWMGLLWRNRFAFSIWKLPIVLAVTAFSVGNSLLRVMQERIYGRKAATTPIKDGPVFILGHWRSGTTLLHELLVLDRRHNYPTTYQCMAPNHFLITESYVSRWLGFVLPKSRPMDNMTTGWDKPQEDEFALANMGLPTPYLTIAFPNRGLACSEYLDMEGIAPTELERWKNGLLWFLKRVTFGDPRRIILKSPPHTGRIKELLETFPKARFIHIVRDPHAIVPSSLKLWKSLYESHGLQTPKCDGLESQVFDWFERMYRNFDEHRALIDPARFYELRYEDLIRDPVGQIRALYEHLELGDFEQARPALEEYFREKQDYRTNRHQLKPELCARIERDWGWYLERYGYGAANGESAAERESSQASQ